MTQKEIVLRTEKLINPILDKFNFDLWDVEYVKEGSGFFLRAYIDKEGGITIDDCVDVSRLLSDRLDEEDFIDDEYTLEISSPGVERQLKKDIDFERSIGKEVYIKLYAPVDKQKEFVGTLESFDKETVKVSLHNAAKNTNNAAKNTNNTMENTNNAAENTNNTTNNINNDTDKSNKIINKADNNTDNTAGSSENINNNTDTAGSNNPIKSFNRKDIALIRLYAEF